MALYDATVPPSAYARNPVYGGGNLLVNKYGKSTLFGDVLSTALPIVGAGVGALVGGPAGIGIGTELGKLGAQGLAELGTSGSANFRDSADNAQATKGRYMGLSAVGGAAASLASPLLGGLKGAGGEPTTPPLPPFEVSTPTAYPSILPPVPGAANAQVLPNSPTAQPWSDETLNATVFGTSYKPKASSFFKPFERGGSVIPYRYGMVRGAAPRPTDYTLYDEDDHTEDLPILTPDGYVYGALRVGEYVMNQHRSLVAGDIMRQELPDTQKINALGHLLHEQLTQVPIPDPNSMEPVQFKDGGSVSVTEQLNRYRRSPYYARRQGRKTPAEAEPVVDGMPGGNIASDRLAERRRQRRANTQPAPEPTVNALPGGNIVADRLAERRSQRRNRLDQPGRYTFTPEDREVINTITRHSEIPTPTADRRADRRARLDDPGHNRFTPEDREVVNAVTRHSEIPDRSSSAKPTTTGSTAIMRLQRQLREQGFVGEDGKPLKVDGIRGRQTRFAEAAQLAAAARETPPPAVPLAYTPDSTPQRAIPISTVSPAALPALPTIPAEASTNYAVAAPAETPMTPSRRRELRQPFRRFEKGGPVTSPLPWYSRAVEKLKVAPRFFLDAAGTLDPGGAIKRTHRQSEAAIQKRETDESKKPFTAGWKEKLAYKYVVPNGYDFRDQFNGTRENFNARLAEERKNKDDPTNTFHLNKNDSWRVYLGMTPEGNSLRRNANGSYSLHEKLEQDVLRDGLRQRTAELAKGNYGKSDTVTPGSYKHTPTEDRWVDYDIADIMGNYTVKKGQDEKGHYVGYHDYWDLDPQVIPGKEWSKIPVEAVVGKPYHIEGKIYYDPKTGKRIGTPAANLTPPAGSPAPAKPRLFALGGPVTPTATAMTTALRKRQQAALDRLDRYEQDLEKHIRAGTFPNDMDVDESRRMIANLRKQVTGAYNPGGAVPMNAQIITGKTSTPERYDTQALIDAENRIASASGNGLYMRTAASKKVAAEARALGLDLYGRPKTDPNYGVITGMSSTNPSQIKTKYDPASGYFVPETATPTAAKPSASPAAKPATTGGGAGRAARRPGTSAAPAAKTATPTAPSTTAAPVGGAIGQFGTQLWKSIEDRYAPKPRPQQPVPGPLGGGVPTTMPTPAAKATPAAETPAPPTAPAATPVATNWQQGLTDVGRLAAGVALAAKPVDRPTIPDSWKAVSDEATAQKEQGLSAVEQATAQAGITNGYRQGVSALAGLTGGGSSSSTVLGGLAQLNANRMTAEQNLLLRDEARRQQNRARFGAVSAQTAQMEAGIQQEGINRQTAAQNAGQQLIGQTLANVENRQIMQRNQPLYDAILTEQLRSQQEAADADKAMREYYKAKATALS